MPPSALTSPATVAGPPLGAIPGVPLTERVLGAAAARGARPALVDAASGRTLTYAELAGGAERAAAGFAARGVGRGDVVALMAPNIPEFPLVLYGIAGTGAAITTVNPLVTAGELARQLADAGARAIVTVPPFLATAREAAEQAGVDDVIVLGEADGATSLGSVLAAGGEAPAPAIDPARDVVLLPYSSGTTGVCKGVMLTHGNVVAHLEQLQPQIPLGEDDRMLAVAPFFHALGLMITLNHSLARGATVVCLPRFDLEAFLRAIEEHRITHTLVVPPIAQAIAAHPSVERYDLSSLKLFGFGAAPAPAELEEACAQRLGCLVGQGYGMTEATATISTPIFRIDAPIFRRGSVGRLLPGTEVKVVDPQTGEQLPPQETGELWIRGPHVMTGYLGRRDATDETLVDGWLRTGDLGHFDDDGFLYIVDRLKELIKYKAFQVAPAELEGLLLGHPEVADVAVIGAPDAEAGEIPVAYVVPAVRPDALDRSALMAWVAERVAPHKRIRRVEIVEEIPKSPQGKILRRVLAGAA